MNEFGKKIKEARKRKKITQTQLAEKIGVTKHAIAKYEQGQREPNLQMLTKIIDELDIDFWELNPSLDLEIEAKGPYIEGIEFGEEVYNRMKHRRLIEEKSNRIKNSIDFKNIISYNQAEYFYKKLAEIEYNEYSNRIMSSDENLIDECYVDLKSFRKDIYKEISDTILFAIELKLKEAEEKIKQY